MVIDAWPGARILTLRPQPPDKYRHISEKKNVTIVKDVHGNRKKSLEKINKFETSALCSLYSKQNETKWQRRFLNICLHGNGPFYNWELVPITGSCKADNIRILVEKRLKDFNLCFERHIVATISDEPNVMKRFVADSSVKGIFCWNNGIGRPY